jgi:two-component sensor histidine kinase
MTFVSIPPVLEERTLLLELNHRINNEFASVINLVSVAAVRADNSEVKAALSDIVELLHEHAEIHQALKMPDRDGLIEAADHLAKLCFAMSRSRLDRMNIHLVFSADPLRLQSDRCWRLALAVCELVTNSMRHAYFEGRDGLIKVELALAGQSVSCRVSDTGTDCRALKPGQGLGIVRDLAKALGGDINHAVGADGAACNLLFPLTEREQFANPARARGPFGRTPARQMKTVSPPVVVTADQTSRVRRKRPTQAVEA